MYVLYGNYNLYVEPNGVNRVCRIDCLVHFFVCHSKRMIEL